jgi:hypothetical protein
MQNRGQSLHRIAQMQGADTMIDRDARNLWHVILTPVGVALAEPLDRSRLAELPMEVCDMEPLSPERAQELIELFATLSAGQTAPHQHADGPCPICSPPQRELVADAVRRALWDPPSGFS